METVSIYILGRDRLLSIFPSIRERLLIRLIALLLTVLLFSAQVVEGFHHHDDGAEHHDCPVCCAACLKSDDILSVPPLCIERIEFTVTIPPVPIRHLVSAIFPSHTNSRAPPA